MNLSIAPCRAGDLPTVLDIINQSAAAYKGHIPADCWHEPYMPESQFQAEIARGVEFFGASLPDGLVGVMGTEKVKDVMLIRHAYIRPAHRRLGIGQRLLTELRAMTARPVLIGTWADATWAVRFYQKNGFSLVTGESCRELLDRYWAVSDRQKQVSVVLVDERWRSSAAGSAKGKSA